MSRMNWDRVNRENRALSEANRILDPEPSTPGRGKKHKSKKHQPRKRRRMTEKERALAWHRQNRPDSLATMTPRRTR